MNETHFNSFASTSASLFQGNSNQLGQLPSTSKDEMVALGGINPDSVLTPFGQNPGEAVVGIEPSEGAGVVPEAEEAAMESSTMAGPLAIGALALNNAITNSQIASDTQRNQSGQGLAGSSFAADYQQRADVQHDQELNMENTAMIVGGSLLGPEGTAVGMIAAGVNSTLNSAPEATVTSNLGTQVPVSNLT